MMCNRTFSGSQCDHRDVSHLRVRRTLMCSDSTITRYPANSTSPPQHGHKHLHRPRVSTRLPRIMYALPFRTAEHSHKLSGKEVSKWLDQNNMTWGHGV